MRHLHNKTIDIIIPCLNEEDNIPVIYERLQSSLMGVYDFRLIFIDDGSSDNTLTILQKLSTDNPRVKYISLSRNFGHQTALKAGYDYATADAVICMDGDLQHPIKVIHQMVERWCEGYEIVHTKRLDNISSNLKRYTSDGFYRIYNYLSKTKLTPGTADFRLIDKKVLNEFNKLSENNLFIRGIFCWMGFKQCVITYYVEDRFLGKSKYSFKRMISLSIDGFTSFSISPLRISSFIGIVLSLFSFFYALYALYSHYIINNTVQGWTSLMVCFLFMSGLQFILIGIIGEYIGKVFLETKKRPLYLISEHNI